MGFIPDYASMIGVIIKLQVQITLGYESPAQSDEFMSEDEIRSQMKKKKGKALMEHFNPKFDGESEETTTLKPLGGGWGIHRTRAVSDAVHIHTDYVLITQICDYYSPFLLN